MTLRNSILASPSDTFFVPEVLQAIKETAKPRWEFLQNAGLDEPGHSPILSHVSCAVSGMAFKYAHRGLYAVPMFSDVFCRLLMDEIQGLDFEPNEEEDYLRQIPEVLLREKAPELDAMLMEIARSAFNLLFFALFQREITAGAVQIAKYSPDVKAATAWHHDKDSDITVVVPLNTGDYKGGGTEFYGRGVVAPLPSGNMLVFPAYTHLHRGLPTLEGDRYLLVFWLKSEPPQNGDTDGGELKD